MTETKAETKTEIKDSLQALLDAIQNSDAFKRYQQARTQIHQYPEKAKMLHEFRRKNFVLQNTKEPIDLFSETDRLEHEYSDFRKDPVIAEFLSAEVAVCRIVQKINLDIIACLDFEEVMMDE